MTTTSARPAAIGWRAIWAGTAIVVTAVVLVGAVGISGAAQPRLLGDPGTLVRWGLPAAVSIHHLAMSIVLASLAFVLWIARAGSDGSRLRARLVAVGRWAAIIWAVSAVAVLFFCFADTIGRPLFAEVPGGEFASYAWGTTPGRARLAVVVLAGLVAVLLQLRRGRIHHPLATVLTAAAVVPLSMDGHALSEQVPWAAAGVLAIHVVGVVLWVGGVIILGLLADLFRPAEAGTPGGGLVVFQRFSRLAGIAYAAVFVSGVATAVLRIPSIEALATPYGVLVLLKTAAILVLGVIGYLHRRWIVAATRSGMMPTAPVARLVAVEILVMGATIALAVALGRTMPPMTGM
ncbi:CopD family protein [Micrococcaceae bacterium RIT802]|nr:CopD family protein [Micrococcaceae bacterium RIT 802]